MKWLVNLCALCILVRASSGQSIVGGSRGVKGSYSQQSQKMLRQSSTEVITARECDTPNVPRNGKYTCGLENGNTYKCTAVCDTGYSFPDQTKNINLQCNQLNGRWMPYRNFPDCFRSYGGGSSGSSFVQGSYYAQGSRNSSGRGLCRHPETPLNGELKCSMSNGQWSCQATCDARYVFPDGSRIKTIRCHDRDGIWSPIEHFEDCLVLCHPACENGGSCLIHNRCNCPPSHRGNRCQFPVDLCDFRRLTSKPVRHQCADLPDYTECRISCPPGTTFKPPSASVYRCTLNGLWNPPTAPECVRENLCEYPPPPSNGHFNCRGNANKLMCVANCKQGYVFSDGSSQFIIQCSRRTGEWIPHRIFPNCEYNSQMHRGTNELNQETKYVSSQQQQVALRKFGSSRQPQFDRKKTESSGNFGRQQDKAHSFGGQLQINHEFGGQQKENFEFGGQQQINHEFGGQQPINHEFGGQQKENYEFGGQQQLNHEFGGQQQINHEFEGPKKENYEFGGQQQLNHEFGGQQQINHEFGGQQKENYEFGGQQQLNHEFGGQQQINHEFGGQKKENYEFGGQQQINHEFGGQQEVNHEFGGEQKKNYEFRGQQQINHEFGQQEIEDGNFNFASNTRRNHNARSGQGPEDYSFQGGNLATSEKFSVVESHLRKQEQGSKFSADLPKGGVGGNNRLGYDITGESQSHIRRLQRIH